MNKELKTAESDETSLKEAFANLGHDIKTWLKQAFVTDLDQIYKTPENEEEEARIKKIRKVNLIEFLVTLFGLFIIMWTLWWQGVRIEYSDPALGETLQFIAFTLIAIIAVWALLFSPFFHYKLENGMTYRKGYLGLDYEQNGWTAFFEERGFGSLKRHQDDNLADAKTRTSVNYMMLIVLLTIILVMFDDPRNMRDFAAVLGVTVEADQFTSGLVAIVIAYQIIGVILALYSAYLAGNWEPTGSNDLLKRLFLLIFGGFVAFCGILTPHGFGINFDKMGGWSADGRWTDLGTMYQTTVETPAMLLTVVVFLAFLGLLWFLGKYFFVGILIRFDNLKTAIYQFILVSIAAVIMILLVWWILTLPAVNDYVVAHHKDSMVEPPEIVNMWYIFDSTAIEDMNSASFGDFMGNWAGYIYWGLLQQLLFLGYWCTLLTKVSKNKFVNAGLASLAFGLIHFPSWPLVIFTGVGGFLWAIAWQRNDARNIFIIGAIHGFAGTMVSRIIPITMSVGPSNMM